MSNNIVKLGEIAELIRGVTYKPNEICTKSSDHAVACIRTKNIQSELDKEDIIWIPKSIIKNPRKFLQAEDILVSSANSWNLVGKACWVAPLTFTAIAGGFISILRGNPSEVDSRYLFYWFTSNRTQTKLRSFSNKTTNISNLDHKKTLNIKISLPSIEEQQRIAKILDKTFQIKRSITIAKNLSLNLKQSIFVKRFGDPSLNPYCLPTKKIKDVVKSENNQRIPIKANNRGNIKGSIPYYGASGIIDYVNNYTHQGERLLIGEDGANLISRSTPIAYIAKGSFWVNNHAHVLASTGKVNLHFLEIFFSLISLEPYLTGSAQPKLNQSNLNNILVPLPAVNEQLIFSKLCSRIDYQQDLLVKKMHLSEELIKSISTDLLE